MSEHRPETLGELRASGWRDRTVKEELRANLIARMQGGGELFPGIVGYEESVLPALERAILAGHDVVLLGERGQGKTRLIRRLVELLDDEIPIVAGSELNDSPLNPMSLYAKNLIAEHGDDTRVEWVGRDRRYAEKLATPDTSVADLIGDVDPIRVAEGRYLADEMTIHFGLVPRTNRGIFSINELPDLPTRIQVSLLNVLEERDVQIRGYTINLPIDVLLIASANPEDYTNRGRIITPLKDRFGSEIRTHYPTSIAHEIEIMNQEASPPPDGLEVQTPEYIREIVAEFTHAVRDSTHINQRSGVSVRFSIANLETVVASAVRRGLRTGATTVVPRVSDLAAVSQSSMGRIEFEVFEEGREAEILRRLLAAAMLEVFRAYLSGFDFEFILHRFDSGALLETGDLTSDADLLQQLGEAPGMAGLLTRLGISEESPAHTASALEFALEGLHLTRRLNKTSGSGTTVYGIA
jgi:magnesium chelatase subunit I